MASIVLPDSDGSDPSLPSDGVGAATARPHRWGVRVQRQDWKIQEEHKHKYMQNIKKKNTFRS